MFPPLAPGYCRQDWNVEVFPSAKSILDEADNTVKDDVMLQAFIDNSLEAWHGRARRQGANPRVSIAFHDGDTPALVIEDNGRGMSLREATNSIRLGYPGQRPAEDQEALTGDRVLPLKSYLDWKLGRFGRGLTLAAAFWGGLWTIDTVEEANPRVASKVMFGYALALDKEQRGLSPGAAWGGCLQNASKQLDQDSPPFTRITITNLRPDKLAKLRDPGFRALMARQLSAAYYPRVYGITPLLCHRLPGALTRDSDGVWQGCAVIDVFRDLHGGCTLSDELRKQRPQSDVALIMEAVHNTLADKPGVDFCAVPLKYCPPKVPGPGAKGAAAAAQPPNGGTASGPAADTVRPPGGPAGIPGGATPGPITPAIGASGGRGTGVRFAAGPAPGAGAGPSGSHGAAQTPAAGEQTGAGAGVEQPAPKDCPCEFLVMPVYLPKENSQCTKPLPVNREGHDVHCVVVWGGKVLTEEQLARSFPTFIETAARRAKDMLATQLMGYKLRDPGRLVLLVFASPHVPVHLHKAQLLGNLNGAYEMLLSAGPNHKRPASVTAPRLFTYVGYHRLRDPEAPTVNTAAAAATLADAADPPPGKAGGKGRSKRGAGGGAGASTSTAPPSPPAGSGAGGQGIGAFVPPALVPPEAVTAAGELQVTETGWRQDQDGGWLVRMLLDVFAHSWQLQDEDGCILHGGLPLSAPRTHAVPMEELEVREPVASCLEDVGYVETGDGYAFGGRDCDPLALGEMVCLASKGAPGLHTLGQGDRQWVRNASKVYNLEKLYRQSGVEFAVVRPWRPSWAPLAAAVRVHVGRLQPLVALKHGGNRRGKRRAEQDKYVRAWEAMLPYRLAFAEPAPRDEYDTATLAHLHELPVVLCARDPDGAAQPLPQPQQQQRRLVVDMADVKGMFKHYQASAELLIERLGLDKEAQHQEVVHRKSEEFMLGRVVFNLAERLHGLAPGDYRVTVSCTEGPDQAGVAAAGGGQGQGAASPDGGKAPIELLDPARRMVQHIFRVTHSPPVALDARLLRAGPATEVRLGEELPTLEVRLINQQNVQVPFTPELVSLLETRPGGRKPALEGAPLFVGVNNASRNSAVLSLRDRNLSIAFSQDRKAMLVRGLAVKPQKLLAQGTDGTVSRVDAAVVVGLMWGDRELLPPPVEGGGTDPRLRLQLCSGPPHGVAAERGQRTWLAGTQNEPLQVCKGARSGEAMLVRVLDRSGNPYRHRQGDPPPQAQLVCRSYTQGGRVPVQVLPRRTDGSAPPPAPVSSAPLPLDDDGDTFVVRAGDLVVTGVPGDVGILEVVPLQQQQQQQQQQSGGRQAVTLKSFVMVKQVLCSVKASERCYDAELELDGSVRFKSGRPATFTSLQQLQDHIDRDEQGAAAADQGLLARGFKKLVHYTSSGPVAKYMTPSGEVLGSEREVLARANAVLARGARPAYEQCFVLKQATMELRGLEVCFADADDDQVDANFTAAVRVLVNDRVALDGPALAVQEGRVKVRRLAFQERDFTVGGGEGGRTARVRLVDNVHGEELGGFYVRQDPVAVALCLAPVDCALLLGAQAVSPPPSDTHSSDSTTTRGGLGPAAPTRGTLQRRGAAAAAAATAAASALLQLQPARGGGQAAPLDGSVLLAKGFALMDSWRVRVTSGTAVRVPLLLLDASGWPLVPDLAQQDTLRNGLKAAATPKGPAAAQAGTLQAVVESWQWPEAAGGADEGAQPPVIWVSVRVTANRGGSASLRLLYDKPGGARLGDPGVVPSLAVTLPLQLASGALVAGGCALRAAAGADGVTVRKLSAEEEHCLAAQHQGLVATGQPHNCWLVNCGELTSLRLEVDMQDASGCQLSEDVAFGARGSALFPDLPAWARAGRTRDGTWRAPPLAIGMGAEWRDRSHLLVLTPVGAAAAQGAGPLYIQVAVKPGRYPTALRLTHLTGMPADGRIALRPDAAAAAGAGVRCLLPLEFQVAVDSADGVPLRREELGPLQLAYACRQASSQEWAPYNDLQLEPLEPPAEAGPGPQAGTAYACRAWQLPMPTTAGNTAWRLVATYPLGRGGDQAAALEPLVVAEFGVAPGPEAALQVDTWGPQPRRVERGCEVHIPVCVVDRCGNAVLPGSGARKALERGTSVRLQERELVATWAWPDEEEAQPESAGAVLKATLPDDAPVRGDTSLLLSYTPPRTASRGAAGVVDALPQVALPLHVSAGPLAKYAVAAAEAALNMDRPADGVTVEALSANLIPARAAEEERRLPTPPADQPRSCWKVQCRELTQLRLRVELQDAKGHRLTDAVRFELQGSELLLPEQQQQRGREQHPQPLVLQAADGVLELPPLAIGVGEGWRAHTLLLVLKPTNDQLPAGAGADGSAPLCIFVQVLPGRYPLQLVLRGPFADGEPIAPDSCIHVQLSNPEEGQLGRPALLPLSFEVEVQDLEGEELRAEDLGQLRLAYEVAQGGTEAEGGLEWALYDKITISEQAPGESGGYVMGPRTIPMPTEAGDGCTWRLVATYAGTPEVQAPAPPPLVMATFTIGAAPPAQLLLSPGCLEALQADKWLRLQRNTAAAPLVTGRAVAFEGLAQAAVPDLVGLLADGWGNACAPGGHTPVRVALVTRPEAPVEGVAVASVPHVLAEAAVGPGSGAFTLPRRQGGLDNCGLQVGGRYALWLELRRSDSGGGAGRKRRRGQEGGEEEEQEAEDEAEEGDGGTEGPAVVEPLQVGVVHVTRGTARELRQLEEDILAQIKAKEQELEAAKAQLSRLREDLSDRQGEVAAARDQLRDMGVPEGALQPDRIQATIHTAGQHSAGCRQAIRDQAGDTQQYEPLRRDHKSGQGKCNTVQALQQMFAGWPGVLGPLGALGAVECEDVAKALTIVGFNPTLVVCVGKEATQAVKARINQTPAFVGKAHAINLANWDVAEDFDLRPKGISDDHPQGPLGNHPAGSFRRLLEAACRELEQRYPGAAPLGFAENLVRLRPGQPGLDTRVRLQDGREVTLRQSLWHKVFGDAMVFREGAHILEFRQICEKRNTRLRNRLVALDGRESYNVDGKGVESSAKDMTAVGWFLSGVPAAELIDLAPSAMALDPRVRAAQDQLRHSVERRRLLLQLADAPRRSHEAQVQVAHGEQQLDSKKQEVEGEVQQLEQQLHGVRDELADMGEEVVQAAGRGAAGRRKSAKPKRQFGGGAAVRSGGAGGSGGEREAGGEQGGEAAGVRRSGRQAGGLKREAAGEAGGDVGGEAGLGRGEQGRSLRHRRQ